MGFFSRLFGRRQKAAPVVEHDVPDAQVPSMDDIVMDLSAAQPETAHAQDETDLSQSAVDIVNRVSADLEEGNAAPGIWDMDDDKDDSVDLGLVEAPSKRKRRNKTRLIGFDTSQNDVVSLFDDAPAASAAKKASFPVGWLVICEGPGRGNAFELHNGLSQIGRDEDQSVQLDFGDAAISRSNHASIAYDSESHAFHLGHGGKSNIVRLNDMPVLSTEALTSGDRIRVGDTHLRFVALCGDEFNWGGDDTKEDGNVESA